MNNNLTLPSLTPDPLNFQANYPTYEGEMKMPTIQMTEEEFDLNLLNQNLAARNAIQLKCPPSVKISDFYGDEEEWDKTVNECISAAYTNKGDLIELLFQFSEAGEYDSCKCKPDYYWVAEIVSGSSWTEEIHKHYYEHYYEKSLKFDPILEIYEMPMDHLSETINKCYNHFYPLY